MSCGDSCVKYILFFFNLFFSLCGLVLLGIGIAFKLKWSHVTELVSGLNVQPILFIIVGAIVFIIAFFGCCGAVKESNCMMVTYAILMIIIILIQVIIAIIVFVYIGDLETALRQAFTKSFEDNIAEKEAAVETWNLMQKEFQCCGVSSPHDYPNNVPKSCCQDSNALCSYSSAFQYGCLRVVSDFLKTGGNTLAGIAIGVAVVEVISVIFALCFANSIRNADRRYG